MQPTYSAGAVLCVWSGSNGCRSTNTPELLKGANVNDDLSATQVKKMFEGKDKLKPNPHFQTLNDLRLAWAVLSVQMEVWAVRRSPFSVPPDDKIDNSFAQRAVVDEIYP